MLCVETESFRESEPILENSRRSQGSLNLISPDRYESRPAEHVLFSYGLPGNLLRLWLPIWADYTAPHSYPVPQWQVRRDCYGRTHG